MGFLRESLDTVTNIIGSNAGLNRLKGDGSFTDEYNKMRKASAKRSGAREAADLLKAGKLDVLDSRIKAEEANVLARSNKGNQKGAERAAAGANERQELLDGYKQLAAHTNGDDLAKSFKMLSNGRIDAANEAQREALRGMGQAAKNYYFDGTLGERALRIGATAGAVGAAAVGTRYATGGTATTNNRGQRDIAGIPFI